MAMVHRATAAAAGFDLTSSQFTPRFAVFLVLPHLSLRPVLVLDITHFEDRTLVKTAGTCPFSDTDPAWLTITQSA